MISRRGAMKLGAAGLLSSASGSLGDASSRRATVAAQEQTGNVEMFRGNAARTGEMPGPGPDPAHGVQERWRFDTGDGVFDSSPAVVDGVVYVMGIHNLYALDAATGAERWRFAADSLIDSSPAVVDGVVYIGSGYIEGNLMDPAIYAVDSATGAERWRFPTSTFGSSSPAVIDGVVYVGRQVAYFYALDAATGAERWQFTAGGGVDSSPAVVDGVVYVGSFDGNVYALDAATGAERWRFATGDFVSSSPAVLESVVYVGSADGNVYALDAATGAERWRFPTGGNVNSSAAAVDGVVYVGGKDGNLYALDAATGVERWQFATGDIIYSSPTVADGIVYLGQGGNVYALDAAVGTEWWRFETGSYVRSSPVVVDGVVYVASEDGNVYALASARPQPEEGATEDVSQNPTSSADPAGASGVAEATVLITFRGCPEGFVPDVDDPHAACTIPLDAPDASQFGELGVAGTLAPITTLEQETDGSYVLYVSPGSGYYLELTGLEPVIHDGFHIYGVDDGYESSYISLLHNGDTREIFVFYFYD